jgi:predicted Zn-dependent peptidase
MFLALSLVLAALPPLSLEGHKVQLENGLTVIIQEDRSIPGVAVEVFYRVGSKDEEPGRTGFAHLFEHLMFMGARYVPYPQFDTIMETSGGTNNASTSNDHTWYYESGPSNLLETFLWMEADRMATFGLDMTADKLDTQKQVVLNERRQSYEARPYGTADLVTWESVFPPGHPYHWPPIGAAQDIEAAQLDDVKRFFARWYVPSNAILSIVGDVDRAQAEALARKYFGWIPSPPKPAHASAPPPPVHPAEIRKRLTDKVELPKLIVAWPSPPVATPGDAECDVLSIILGRGKASRLYRRLVHEKELAAEVATYQDSNELASTFAIEVMARPGKALQALEVETNAVLAELLKEGPTQSELDAARTILYTGYARALEGLQARAHLLNRMELLYGDPNALGRELARYEALTPKGVAEVARRVLGAPGRVVVEVHPEEKAAGGEKGASR